MTFDPTTNRIQWMHLTNEERKALKAWKHGWEYWSDLSEEYVPEGEVFNWLDDTVYRAKPAPVVNSTWYNVFFSGLGRKPYAGVPFNSPKEARDRANRAKGCFTQTVGIIRLDLIDGKLSVEVEQ